MHAQKEKCPWSHLRRITEVIPMQWNWPVMVSNLEAQAFCRWKGSRLGKKIRLLSHEEHKLIVEKTELPAGRGSKNVGTSYAWKPPALGKIIKH